MTESKFPAWTEPGTTCLVRISRTVGATEWREVTVTRRTKASVFTTSPYRNGPEARWVEPKWNRNGNPHLDEFGGSNNSLYPLDTPLRAEEQEKAAARKRWQPAADKARAWSYGAIPTVEQARAAAAALNEWAAHEEARNNGKA